jgi:dihydropteroate synthase
MIYIETDYLKTNLIQLNIQKTINIKGSLLDLSTPKVMGVINVTPDSFYGGSRKVEMRHILDTAEQMLTEGASFIDVGGYSSRPGAVDISVEEEVRRITKPISEIVKYFPELYISIDTFRSKVAQAAHECGASIVNDISAGDLDPDMFETVAKLKVPYIAMHMKGTPQNMIQNSNYDDLIKEITVEQLESMGVHDIILDPGFGFAKTIEQNFQLLNGLEHLKNIGKPLLAGLSRKSMIYKSLKIEPDGALNGTTVLNTVALLKGVSILRVHDVKQAVEAVQLINKLKN